MASSSSTACAACRFQHRKCKPDCVFAPHFPATDPQKYITVHEVFGASFALQRLERAPAKFRGEAVKFMVLEANLYRRDPTGGCGGVITSLMQKVRQLEGGEVISSLMQKVKRLEEELAQAKAQCYQGTSLAGDEGFTSAANYDQMSMVGGSVGAIGMGEINPFHNGQVFFTNAANFNQTSSIVNSVGQSDLVVDANEIGGIGPLHNQEVGPIGAQSFSHPDNTSRTNLVVDGQVGVNGVAPTGVDLFQFQPFGGNQEPFGGNQDQFTEQAWSFDELSASMGLHAYGDGEFQQNQLLGVGAWHDWNTSNPN